MRFYDLLPIKLSRYAFLRENVCLVVHNKFTCHQILYVYDVLHYTRRFDFLLRRDVAREARLSREIIVVIE